MTGETDNRRGTPPPEGAGQELSPYDDREYERNLAQSEQLIDGIMAEAGKYLEPIGIDAQFFAQAALTARTKDPHLMNADRKSFTLALLKCAQRGLLPDGESAVLVAFKRNVTLIPMVGGMIDIVRRNVPGIAIEANVARVWDEYEVEGGTNPLIVHRIKPMPIGSTIADLNISEKIQAAYCIVTLPPQVPGALPLKESHHMWREEIERIRAGVRGAKNPTSPWVQHPARMYEKTVIRAAFRRLPSRHQIFASADSDALDDYSPEGEGQGQGRGPGQGAGRVAALRPPPKLLI